MEKSIPRGLAAVLLIAGAAGCAPEQPRILATFRQGVETYNFAPQLGSPGYYYAPPTLVGGHVYLGTSRRHIEAPAEENWFFKLDAGLRKVWEFDLGRGEVRGPATLDDAGNVYFVVEFGRGIDDWSAAREYLYSLRDDGAFRWRFEITGERSAARDMGMLSPAVGADGTIYVGGGALYALDPSGALKWSYTHRDASWAIIVNAPIIDPAGNLYFHALRGVYSLSPDGAERWVFPISDLDDGLSSPAFSVAYDRVYAASSTTLYCLDAETGGEIWRNTPLVTQWGGDFRATPAVDDANNVYLGTKADFDSTFYAFRADGTLMWERKIGADLYSSPALGDDRTVYVGSELVVNGISHYGARFHALDMATGAEKWTVELLGDAVWSSPALSDAGVLYVATMAGFVYAIRSDASGLLPNAGSPRFHESNASTGRRE